jgi:cellulose synthase operon protein C
LDLTKKIAYAYKEGNKPMLAAAEYERMDTQTDDATLRREALREASDLYVQSKDMDKAFAVYQRYVNEFPKPLEPMLEYRTKMAAYLKTRSNLKDYLGELKLIMDLDANAGSERTPRTRFLGGAAALEFSEIAMRKFVTVRIIQPFDKNLELKKAAMKEVKEQLEKLLGYEVDEYTAAATFYLAEMYYDFNRKLIESDRPNDLSPVEKEQYELSIEEQAFPFEEKAIQVHQKNLDLMTRGIFNTWIEKSLEKLAKLVPARYAKYEESSGFIESFDTMDYRSLFNSKPLIYKSAPVNQPPSVNK